LITLLKAKRKQRTASTHVLAAIRVLNRLEMVVETMRAALNQIATIEPDWLAQCSIPEWFERYSRRAEQSRLPTGTKAREAFAARVGEDGFHLLKLLAEHQPALLKLEKIETLRKVWRQHYTRDEASDEVRWRHGKETMRAAASIESPYDVEAKYSRKDVTKWTGYKVHLSETCDEQLPHLITNVHTTGATTQDVASTADIQDSLYQKGLPPSRHLVDAGYVDGDLLVRSADQYKIELFGPTRINSSWQSRTGGIDATQFEVDWDHRKVICPAGKRSADWLECQTKEPYPRRVVKIKFKRKDCLNCENRTRCVRSKTGAPRQLLLQARESFMRRSKKPAPCSPAKPDIRNISNAPELKERFHKASGAAQSGVRGTSDYRKRIFRRWRPLRASIYCAR
jgi:transposase